MNELFMFTSNFVLFDALSSFCQELYSTCNPVVSKAKPKVELPKEEKTENGPVNGQEAPESQQQQPPAANQDKSPPSGTQQEAAEGKLPEMDID